MKKSYVLLIVLGIIVVLTLSTYGYYKSNYNGMVILKENVTKQWSNVENVYQRRLDLIPNLVNTVKGYANFEKETLTQVIEARAKATSVNINAQNLDPASFQKFQQAQGGLTSALSRLMVVVEKYPDLKANQNFLELQAQLEGTENRIAVERGRYNDNVNMYNMFIKQFPRNVIFRFTEMPYFQADEAASKAPKVEF
jgi:LemA protein